VENQEEKIVELLSSENETEMLSLPYPTRGAGK